MSYREVTNPDRVLQQPLEADSPAGHPSLRVAAVALDARQASITVKTVVAAAALQLHTVQLCLKNTHTQSHLWGHQGCGLSQIFWVTETRRLACGLPGKLLLIIEGNFKYFLTSSKQNSQMKRKL